MSWDGFVRGDNGEFPFCKRCGKQLNADGGHPAEVYLGTFTGICYACEGASPYVVRRYTDGASVISYPPHCPSYRRDRENYTGYADCEECKGTGRHYVSRSFSQGGSYYTSCKACFERFHEHPLRKRAQDTINEASVAFGKKWRKVEATEENKAKFEVARKELGTLIDNVYADLDSVLLVKEV